MKEEHKIPLILIGGPTASGKTAVSLELARRIDSEIISADSRQVYKYLDIGTAKPNADELTLAKHHFIDTLEPDEYFSAGRFGDEAFATARNIYRSGKMPIVVGGSGFYIKALCEGMFEEDSADNSERAKLQQKYQAILEEQGRDELRRRLEKVDPEAAGNYSDGNPRRLIRALEYYDLHGKPFSHAKNETRNRPVKPFYFAPEHTRETLYERINMRTELMWENGLVEETEKVLNMGFSPELNSLNTVGYKECIAFLKGDIKKNEAIEEMKKNTRRYAKRQLTWFRKYDSMLYLPSNPEQAAEEIIKTAGVKNR